MTSSLWPERRTLAVSIIFVIFLILLVIKIKKNPSGETKFKVRCNKVCS